MDLKNPTRTESLLANIAGHTDVPVPDMKNATRSERLLKEILDNGGGGGGGGGDVTKEYVDNAIADAVADIDDDISALSDTVEGKVDKENGKGLSTNDYTDADKALVQNSPITVTATASPLSTANGKPRAITIYGKSEVVDGAIKSAGEGWSVLTNPAQYTWAKNDTLEGNIFYATIPTKKADATAKIICNKYRFNPRNTFVNIQNKEITGNPVYKLLYIRDDDINTVEELLLSLSSTYIAYELADPTQGNCIAIKTDNGTGINGTMAVFSTGTPLREIPETAIKDYMEWDGSSGEVTNVCNKVDLGTLNWGYTNNRFYASINIKIYNSNELAPLICTKYPGVKYVDQNADLGDETISSYAGYIYVKDTTYEGNITTFTTAMSGVKLIYELATPTVTPLTTTELASLSTLKTYSPQTVVTINDNPDYSIEAYANTANGRVVSNMQPTRSPLLTLSASGWTNNAQTVTYAHNIGKRNTIDVEPANIKAWTAAGILATAETASTITFECDTVPTADLSFRVTSMEVR